MKLRISLLPIHDRKAHGNVPTFVGTAKLVLSSVKHQPQTVTIGVVLQIKVSSRCSAAFKKANCVKNSYEGN